MASYRVVVLESYESRSKEGLSLRAGQIIEVLDTTDAFWWLGRDPESKKSGLFPKNRVQVEDAAAEEVKPPAAQKKTVVALYAFAGAESGELPFEAGDSIEVLAKSRSGWWKGRVGEREGIFPANFTNAVKRDEKKEPDAPKPQQQTQPVALASSPPESVAQSGGKERATSPRKMMSGLLSKIKSKVERGQMRSGSGSLDIEHPFEVGAEENAPEKNHFQLLETDAAARGGPGGVGPTSPKEDPAVRQRKRHQFILAELVETEEDYVSDMEMVVELFLVPLRINRVISKQEADRVFLNLPHLIPINQTLLEGLQKQLALPLEEQRVGELFLEFFSSGQIREYMQYASQSVSSGHTLLALQKSNTQWSRFLEDTYPNPKLRDLKIDAFLVKPIQRVCRYPLLLTELRLATPESCADYLGLQKAVDTLGGVISEINERRGESEILHHVVQLENSLKGLPPDLKLVAPGRMFVREALMEKARKGSRVGGRREQFMVWCFTDCLVYGKPQGKAMHFKGVVPFDSALLQNVPDSSTGDTEHAFELISIASKESLVFCCSSRAQKKEWVDDISQIIERNLEAGVTIHKQQRAAAASGSDVAVPEKELPERIFVVPNKKESDEDEDDEDDDEEDEEEEEQQDEEEKETKKDEKKKKEGVSWETMTQGPVQPRGKRMNAARIVLAKGSVRVKGADLSARVIKLRDEMNDPASGLELCPSLGGETGKVFSGHAAIEWTMKRFRLDEGAQDSAVELMVGLLRSGVIVPVRDTPSEDFLGSYTAYYSFAGL